MKDTSDSYDRNMLWMKPTNVFNSFISLFKNESRNRAVFGMLFTCQLAVVVRVGVEYFSIMNLLAYAYMGDITYVYFNISKMVAVVFGALFSGVVLSKCMKVNDIVIGLLTCSVYIVVATCYIFVNRLYQHCIIVIIYLCHGSIIVIMTSLTSKMVETEELGRFNSIQSTIGSVLIFSIAEICRFNNHNKMVHLFMVFFLYAILTLPIVLVLMFLYFKCKDWLKTENVTLQKNSVYTILSSH
ncbi:Major facilitator superfamily domain [Cinara cedri]|uniref:Major facilitator superfamily domain n=1 Tax=Cinara cedri TaxID=506608 RepID=A0A5E4MVE2_9HEMI|nr:Major facilitator superfamily domain [Cinara cedri]